MTPQKRKIQNLDETPDGIYNDDIVFEDGDVVEDRIKKLKERLGKCLKENKENLLGWQRAKADFVNVKKENAEKAKKSSDFAKGEFIEEMLPVIDSFSMAFANKELWEKVDKNWRVGVEYIHSQFMSVLEGNGLKSITPIGEKFDPNFHISIEVVNTDKKKEDDLIVEIVQSGYELNGRVIRAAKVKVAQYKK